MAWVGAVRHLQRGANAFAPSGLSFDRSAQALLVKLNSSKERKWISTSSISSRGVWDKDTSPKDLDDEDEFPELDKFRQGFNDGTEADVLPSSVSECGLCNAPRHEVVCRCHQCDAFLCSSCDQTKHGLSLNSLLSPKSSSTDSEHQRVYYDRECTLEPEELDEVNKFFTNTALSEKEESEPNTPRHSATTSVPTPRAEDRLDPDYRELRDYLYPALAAASASRPASVPASPSTPTTSPAVVGGFAVPTTPARSSITYLPLMNPEKLAPVIISPFSDHHVKRSAVEPADRMMMPTMPPSPVQRRSRRQSLSVKTEDKSRSTTSTPISPLENDSYDAMVQYERAYQAAYEATARATTTPTQSQSQSHPHRHRQRSVASHVTASTPASSTAQPRTNTPSQSRSVSHSSSASHSSAATVSRPQLETPHQTPQVSHPQQATHTTMQTSTIQQRTVTPSHRASPHPSSSAIRPQGRPANRTRPQPRPQQPTSSAQIPQISEQRFQQLQALHPKPRGRPPKGGHKLPPQATLPSAFSALSIHSSSPANGMMNSHKNKHAGRKEDDMSDSDTETQTDDLTSNAAQSIARNLVTWRDTFQVVDDPLPAPSAPVAIPAISAMAAPQPYYAYNVRQREYRRSDDDQRENLLATPSSSPVTNHTFHVPLRARTQKANRHRREQSASPRASVVAAPAILHPASLAESNPFATLLVVCSDQHAATASSSAESTASSTSSATPTTMSSVTTALGHQFTALELLDASKSASAAASEGDHSAMQSVMEGAIQAATATPVSVNEVRMPVHVSAPMDTAFPTPVSYTYPAFSLTASAPVVSTASVGDASYNYMTQFAYPYTHAPDFSPIRNIMADVTVPEYYDSQHPPVPANTNPNFFIVSS